MLTSPERTTVAWPAYRPYRATVARVLMLSPSFRRVTFTGPDFGVFGTAGLDQRIKLVLPFPDGSLCDVGADDDDVVREGSWYARWRALPAAERNPFRTYTVRDIRPERRELDVDMVLHPAAAGHEDGPAASWLRRASVGDEVIIVGPDARSVDPTVGIDWRPGTARHVLLAGDETAAPAICSIIESLDPRITAQAFIEVPSSADILTLVPRGISRVAWLARDAGCETAHGFEAIAPRGELLERAVRAWLPRHTAELASAVSLAPQQLNDIDVDAELLWDSPVDPSTGDFYAWIAGEASTVKSLRRHLVSEIGVDRRNVAFMGYWRDGRSEAQ
ncbi:MAG: siderophore-interacting protein [Actinobacteria bacterium]|nr:siderophore-interacting protein [Actinomycetota bacterium]MBU1608322.1 siderophore-interacting protein [Actinomycetota bacterium]MBU2316826.1 siderophore-interacting protein [Actinomycetota bacterium]MBU2385959.1 siderophore-interacting protein [Actinomycetota bacterium]